MRVQEDRKFEPVQPKQLEVIPKSGEPPERMIKRFMKKVRNDGILQEVYQRRFFEKPSIRRRRKRLRARFVRENLSKELATK